MSHTPVRSSDRDLLAPLLADFQLVGDGIETLLSGLTGRPAPTAA